MIPRLAALGFMCLLAGAVAAAPVAFTWNDATQALATATALVKAHTPRVAASPAALESAAWLRGQARKAGCGGMTDLFTAATPDGTGCFANVQVEFAGADGAEAPWIVFFSHFDTFANAGAGFEGANDGASTSGLLLALATAVRRAGTPNYNVAFLWLDGEEAKFAYGPADGFQGARRAVARFRAKKRKVRAAVNLDMLGDRDLHIELPANGTPVLNQLVLMAARRTGLEACVSQGRSWVADDFSAFLEADWPATDLIDFSYGPENGWWHTPQDTCDKLSVTSLYRAGRLAAELYNVVDERHLSEAARKARP